MNIRKPATAVLCVAALALATTQGDAAILGTYTFTGDRNVTLGTGLTNGMITFSDVAVVGGSNVSTASGRLASDNYPTVSTLNSARYVGFTLGAKSGYRLELTQMSFSHWHERPGNGQTAGPRGGEVRLDTTAAQTFSSTGQSFSPSQTAATTTYNHADVSLNSSTTAGFRIYPFNAADANSDFYLDNIQVEGDVVALARMNAGVTAPTASRVFVGSNVSYNVAVANTATGGTKQDGLNYTISGSNLLGAPVAVNGQSVGSGSVNTAVQVNTSAAGQVNSSVTVTAGNAHGTPTGTTTGSHSVDVVARSNADFGNAAGDATATLSNASNTLTLDFGRVGLGTPGLDATFDLIAQIEAAGFTALLDLDSIVGSGGTGVFALTGDASFKNRAAGTSTAYAVAFDTTTLGTFSATYTFNVSDEDLAGAQSGTLTLNVIGEVGVIPEPATLTLAAAGAALMFGRRRGR